ncbi:phosphatase PAP2 family protein [Amycolatopsis sp.]|uniref:phosphatase PAP2 family protein n=1 Tax=Amycolatopsis sp. TaxID=37632 RepID=UPI002E0BDF0C|nr:phosphatase PAP2 family protein [Amycolatopsis sp.]
MMAGVSAAGSGSGLYDGIAGFAVASPAWLQKLGALYTEVGLFLFGALFVYVWWRARTTGTAKDMALALLAPAVTVAAYLVSEVSKSFIQEERPCRGLAESATVLKCPDVGDWSFPSNHSTIAAAAAVGLLLAWRRSRPWVITMAVAMAFSRVFVGAHYPHDVLAGLFVGAVVAWLLVRALTERLTALVERYADHPRFGWLVGIRPGQEPEPEFEPEWDDSEEPTQLLPRQPRAPRRAPQRPARADQPTVRIATPPPPARFRPQVPPAPRRQPPRPSVRPVRQRAEPPTP